MEDSNFDNAATHYDEQFSNTLIGNAQRKQVWKQIHKNILTISNKRILEINCGTGIDASIWHSHGAQVLATDISCGMIEYARRQHEHIEFQQVDINSITKIKNHFDVLFSNFGGLNCLSPGELKNFFINAELLIPSGDLIIVVMGRKTTWDRLFLRLKGQKKDIQRRNSHSAQTVNVNGAKIKTWYYSPEELLEYSADHFNLKDLKPIGLFVPPSYLSKFFENKKVIFSTLKFLDRIFRFRILSNRADHFYLHLTNKNKVSK